MSFKDPTDDPPSERARMARAQAKRNARDGSPLRGTLPKYTKNEEYDRYSEPLIYKLAESIDDGSCILRSESGVDITTPFRQVLLEAECVSDGGWQSDLDSTESLAGTLMLELVNKYLRTGDECPNSLRALALLLFAADSLEAKPQKKHYILANLTPFRELYCQDVLELGGITDQPPQDVISSAISTRKQKKAILFTQECESYYMNEDATTAPLDTYPST